jgi:DNA-binding Xre family transcriptional regulator
VEEWVTGDWGAVAVAIQQRMVERGVSQRELIDRADLAKATVHEIQNNVKLRNRRARTLRAISEALGWHSDYLAAVLAQRTPPEPGEPYATSSDDVPGRLDVIDHRLDLIYGRLDKVDAVDERLDGFAEEIEAALERIILRHRQPER